MNKKLQEGVESFKQFVLDETNQLTEQNKKLSETNQIVENRYKDLQTRHQDLIATTLALTTEKETLTKKLKLASNVERTVLLEKQIQAYAASHADLINKNSRLRLQNDQLIKENTNLKLVNANLSRSNTKHITINGELIKFLDSIGYGVAMLPVEQSETFDKEFLKKVLGLKYHVEEVKPEPKYDIDFIKNLLTEALGKDFEIHVIGEDK